MPACLSDILHTKAIALAEGVPGNGSCELLRCPLPATLEKTQPPAWLQQLGVSKMTNETLAGKLGARSTNPLALVARRAGAALLSFWLAGPVGADVYKWVDADGLVHYSDEPEAGSKRVTLPELSVVPFRIPVGPAPGPAPAPVAPQGTQAPTAESSGPPPGAPETPLDSDRSETAAREDIDYELVAIRAPANNQTVASPSGELDIVLALQPDLRANDSIQLFLDGQRVRDELRTTHFSISGLEVGSHILEARVVGPEGNMMRRSKSVLFHYQP